MGLRFESRPLMASDIPGGEPTKEPFAAAQALAAPVFGQDISTHTLDEVEAALSQSTSEIVRQFERTQNEIIVSEKWVANDLASGNVLPDDPTKQTSEDGVNLPDTHGNSAYLQNTLTTTIGTDGRVVQRIIQQQELSANAAFIPPMIWNYEYNENQLAKVTIATVDKEGKPISQFEQKAGDQRPTFSEAYTEMDEIYGGLYGSKKEGVPRQPVNDAFASAQRVDAARKEGTIRVQDLGGGGYAIRFQFASEFGPERVVLFFTTDENNQIFPFAHIRSYIHGAAEEMYADSRGESAETPDLTYFLPGETGTYANAQFASVTPDPEQTIPQVR